MLILKSIPHEQPHKDGLCYIKWVTYHEMGNDVRCARNAKKPTYQAFNENSLIVKNIKVSDIGNIRF